MKYAALGFAFVALVLAVLVAPYWNQRADAVAFRFGVEVIGAILCAGIAALLALIWLIAGIRG